MTHTYAVLEVSSAAYQEIKEKLDKAGYAHAFHRDDEHGIVIDMHGIALAEAPFVDDLKRCAVCGWPLVKVGEPGCWPKNCSMRPRPVTLYSPERAKREGQG
jgi:hypothetical protein